MKGRNSPHFLGVNITTDNIESGSCEQLMIFLELLFRGQNGASKQIFGLHIIWTKLQMQPMPFSLRHFLSLKMHNKFLRDVRYMCAKFLYLLFKSKFSGEILRCSKSSKCRCNLTFFSVNLFPGGGRLKISSLCHQNPL